MPEQYRWQQQKKAVVSISFDDARTSQIDTGIPILNRYGLRATFYVSPPNLPTRVEGWRYAVQHGHEIGNHTMTHPCTGNFIWSRENALEDKSLGDIEAELDEANNVIHELLNVTPETFAYPCGQRFVGRGTEQQSYVPVIARRFTAGRGFRDETVNNPRMCDLAHVMGVDSDDLPIDALRAWIEKAVDEKGWLVLCSHDVGDYPRQAVRVSTLRWLCDYCSKPDSDVWIDTIAAVASHIKGQRSTNNQTGA